MPLIEMSSNHKLNSNDIIINSNNDFGSAIIMDELKTLDLFHRALLHLKAFVHIYIPNS